MSFTLNNLKKAEQALIDGDTLEAMRRIKLLIERMETILHTRENWTPKWGTLKELNDGDNRNAESG